MRNKDFIKTSRIIFAISDKEKERLKEIARIKNTASFRPISESAILRMLIDAEAKSLGL